MSSFTVKLWQSVKMSNLECENDFLMFSLMTGTELKSFSNFENFDLTLEKLSKFHNMKKIWWCCGVIMERKWSIETPRKVSISILSPLNGVFHFMESYWSHYGVFNHFQLEKNEFSVVLMEFCYHIMVNLWSF